MAHPTAAAESPQRQLLRWTNRTRVERPSAPRWCLRLGLLGAMLVVVLAPSTGTAQGGQPHTMHGEVDTCGQEYSAHTWSRLLEGKLAGGLSGYYQGSVSGLGVYAFLRPQACYEQAANAGDFGACVVQRTLTALASANPYAVWSCGVPPE